MSKRREGRERAMQALYALQQSGDSAEHVIKTVLNEQIKNDSDTLKFASSLFLRTVNAHTEVEKIIEGHAKNWDLKRIAIIDMLVLRMAITEFLHFSDIPPKVSINEAIEIAKRFSTPKSGKFVNGILDAVLVSLKKTERIQKSGRGLLDTTIPEG